MSQPYPTNFTQLSGLGGWDTPNWVLRIAQTNSGKILLTYSIADTSSRMYQASFEMAVGTTNLVLKDLQGYSYTNYSYPGMIRFGGPNPGGAYRSIGTNAQGTIWAAYDSTNYAGLVNTSLSFTWPGGGYGPGYAAAQAAEAAAAAQAAVLTKQALELNTGLQFSNGQWFPEE